jgi:peptidoglycan/xylan/chitin deacetylase (PgdA/CDA1 family)
MSRFAVTTLLTFIVAGAAAILLSGSGRIWMLVVIAAGYLILFGIGVFSIRAQFFTRAICRGKSGEMRVALTFDDGPDPNATVAILELLSREKISAAFFCIGKNVVAHPQVAARVAAEGHLLGNHTYRHAWWTNFLRRRGLVDEMMWTQDAIVKAAGATPMYMRPPMGLTNPHYSGALRESGLTLVGWDVRSLDTVLSTKAVIRRILRQTRDGSIILLHDGGASPERIVEIVSTVIGELRAQGFGFERLDRLIAPLAPLTLPGNQSRR